MDIGVKVMKIIEVFNPAVAQLVFTSKVITEGDDVDVMSLEARRSGCRF